MPRYLISMFVRQFIPHSSEVDWCETNYASAMLPFLAEFYNTISNIPFILAPFLFWHLSRRYAALVEPRIWIIWCLLSVIGGTSGLFHATLSFGAQLLDELSILWLMFAGVALFATRHQMPGVFRGQRSAFVLFMLACAIALSLVGFWKPHLNAFLLFLGVAPITYIVGRSLFRGRAHNTQQEGAVWGVALACVVLWAVAISCWVADKFFCRFWSNLGIPYPQWHALWHLFVLVASYLALLLAAYFRACEEAPHLLPRLACWPPPNPRFSIGLGPWAGIPFVDFAADASQLKSQPPHPSDVRAR